MLSDITSLNSKGKLLHSTEAVRKIIFLGFLPLISYKWGIVYPKTSPGKNVLNRLIQAGRGSPADTLVPHPTA